MRIRQLRRVLLWTAALCAMLWWTPALALRFAAPSEIEPLGVSVELAGVRPAGWLGVSIDSARVQRGSTELLVSQLDASYADGGWQAEGRLGAGTFRVRTRRDGRFGLVYFERLPLEPIVQLAREHLPPMRARGAASGVARWSSSVELSVRVDGLQLDLPVLGILDVDTAEAWLAVFPTGRVQLDALRAAGPSGTVAVSGSIPSERELDLMLEIRSLEPRLATLVEKLRPDLLPLPTRMRIQGYTLRPEITRIGPGVSAGVPSRSLETGARAQ